MMKRNILFIAITLIITSVTYGMVGINLFRAYDINLLPHQWCNTNLQWTGWAEGAYKVEGFNYDGRKVPVTQIWSDSQNALGMLRGFPADSEISNFLQNVLGNPADDGTRGRFRVDSSMKAQAYGLFARVFLPHNIIFGAYVPFYAMKLHHVTFKDLTDGTTMEDEIVRENLMNDFPAVLAQLDPTLNITGWHRAGFGDVIAMAEWCRDFKQQKPTLKNVFLTTRLGFNFPTGVKRNENDIFSVPFGLDGSWGLIFGAGLVLDWFDRIQGGLDFQFMYGFGNTRVRRIKVHEDQTDLLLLAKAKTHTELGFFQRYNLFIGVDPLWRGFSAQAIYQFFKHTDDTLSLYSNFYSDLIANTAGNLQEWTMHHIILMLNYDFQCDIAESSKIKPMISFFAKFPINGERAILCSTVGGTISFSF